MMTWRTVRAALPYIVAALALIAVLMLWNGFWSALPWSAEARAKRAEQRASYATQDAENRSLEAQGNADTLQRVETFHREEVVIRDLTSQAQHDARTAPDADTPLSPDLADALRRQSDGLCLQRPGLCAAAPADAS